MRAVLSFLDAFGQRALRANSLHVSLKKRIPCEAGLGGGSSDAAAAIQVLAGHAGVDPCGEECLALARSLGADVPFFLYGGCALMDGYGDRLVERCPAPHLDFALVKPERGVSAREAYAVFDTLRASEPPRGDSQALFCLLGATSGCLPAPTRIAPLLKNDLEAASCELVPEIAMIAENMRSCSGVLATVMAGSGSTVAALCEDARSSHDLVARFLQSGYWVANVHSI
jgi:4-diphosphocytidyl-2-C-methyl-D-erythritol kinase